jgi:hypothetical protein
MTRNLILSVVLGFLVVAGLVGSGLFVSRGAHLQLKGKIQKVRTAALSESRSVAVLDFRVTNPSDYPFVVNGAEVIIRTSDGRDLIGRYIPEVDARVVFAASPLLGEKYNPTIGIRETIRPGQTADRMAAAAFDIPLSQLESRRSLFLRIEDVDGPVSDIRE